MELKVGDKIYGKSYNTINSIHTVERVTKMQAICEKDVRFKLDHSSWINRIGANNYSRVLYYIETDELKNQLIRQNAIYKVDKFDYSKLTTEQLISIISIIGQ